AGAGRVLEGVTVGRSVGEALGWFIDHDPVYPFLTVAQPCGWRLWMNSRLGITAGSDR
ncbi:MAG: hypothetical protein JWQ31_96, partial [Mycobacterium sp.]|nr:hypothetical protein [Mycobacterium sp.]